MADDTSAPRSAEPRGSSSTEPGRLIFHDAPDLSSLGLTDEGGSAQGSGEADASGRGLGVRRASSCSLGSLADDDDGSGPAGEGEAITSAFHDAAESLAALVAGGQKPEQAVLLRLYGLYKQGLVGDVTSRKPGIFDPKGRSKWSAWERLKGLSQQEAMTRYVEEVVRIAASLEESGGGEGGAGAGGVGATPGPPPAPGAAAASSPGQANKSSAGAMGTSDPQSRPVAALEAPDGYDAGNPLHAAAAAGDVAAIERITGEPVGRAAALAALDDQGCTPLHLAADAGSADAVARLLELGAEVDAPDADGLTPLLYAALAGSREVGEKLLAAGADPQTKTSDGETYDDLFA